MEEKPDEFGRLRKEVDALNDVVFKGDGPEKPSLITAISLNNQRLDVIKESLDEFKTMFRELGVTLSETPQRILKTVLIYLSIAVAIITILVFLGPSLRKALDIQPVSQNSKVSVTQNALQ